MANKKAGKKILTKEFAERFIEDPEDLEDEMNECTTIEADAAKLLCDSLQMANVLGLEGLTEIPDSIAKILFANPRKEMKGGFLNHKFPFFDDVRLNGLSEISDSVAALIGQYRRETVELNGIKQLTDIAAEHLSSATNLDLGVSRLSDTSAKHLGKVTNLSLCKLRSLSDVAAESFGITDDAFGLDLSGAKVSDDALEHLCKRGGHSLALGSKEISDRAAETLRQAKVSELYLRKLKSLSDDAAKTLLKFKGELHLKLDSIPKSASAILRKHKSF